MRCPRCGRLAEKPVDYCPYCGAVMAARSGTTGEISYADDEPETEVLVEDYRDFQDTVVEPVMAFDPSLFMSQPTVQVSTVPVAKQDATPRDSSPDEQEQTWVLGAASQQDQAVEREPHPAVHGSGSGSSGKPPSRNGNVPPGGGGTGGGGWQTAPLPAPSSIGIEQANSNRPFVIAIAALAVVAVVGLAVCLALALWPRNEAAKPAEVSNLNALSTPVASSSSSAVEQEEGSKIAQENSTSSSAGSSSAGGAVAGRDSTRVNGSGFSDADAYRMLLDYYSKSADYDKNITKAAQDFNASYADKSTQTRTSKASTAKSLKSQVKSSWDTLKGIDMPFWSQNYDDWETLCDCFECLWHRIDAIDRAWDISLSYDKPAKHESEILAPIKADEASSGKNKYLIRYNELYPTIHLVKP